MQETSDIPSAQTTVIRFAAIVRRLGPLSVLAVIAAALPGLGGFALLYFRDAAASWLLSHESLGVALYVACFALTAGLALLPTYAQAIIGGFVFRFPAGFPAALGGFVGASLIGYGVARLASADRATRLIEEQPKWKVVYDALLGGGFWRTLGIVTLLRVPPNSPFAITNLVLAATRTRLSVYALGTLIGMAPRTAAAVYIGSQLKTLSDFGAPRWYFWVGVALTLVVLGILGALIQNAIHRATQALSAAAR